MGILPLLLVVEDEPLIRIWMAEALQEGGFDLVESGDGTAALAELDAGAPFAGLITDIRIGGAADGWEVARRARQLHPKIAVVYATGDSAADWAAEGVPNSLVLQKPFATAQLLTAISSLLIAVQSTPAQPPLAQG
jgi:CheY-like chemotaxis protein